jgi:hypothetical protein
METKQSLGCALRRNAVKGRARLASTTEVGSVPTAAGTVRCLPSRRSVSPFSGDVGPVTQDTQCACERCPSFRAVTECSRLPDSVGLCLGGSWLAVLLRPSSNPSAIGKVPPPLHATQEELGTALRVWTGPLAMWDRERDGARVARGEVILLSASVCGTDTWRTLAGCCTWANGGISPDEFETAWSRKPL